jgi:outer membrane protein TolC
MGTTTRTATILRLSCIAAASLVASRAMALQPLEDFLAAARERNPDAQQARANLAGQDAQALVALGKQLPGVSARATYERNQFQEQISAFGNTYLIQPRNAWLGNATLTVPLIDLGNFERIAATRTSAESSARSLQATRLAVEARTAQDYYQLLANLALVTAAQHFLEVSRQNLQITETKLHAGAATRLDVDRATADVEQQVQQLAAASLQVALAARDLQSTTSIAPDLSSAAELTDDLHPEADLAVFEAELTNVPSVTAAVAAARAARQQAEAEWLALFPSLSGSFTQYYTNAPGFAPSRWYWLAGVTLSWSFDLTSVGNIRGGDASADAARAQELKASLAAGDAISNSWNTVVANIAQSRSARAGRDAAAHAAEQAQVQYQAGSATQLDLLQAQRDAFRAEATRIQDDANLLNARAQLRLSAGKSLLPAARPARE